jgi:hypothetical protein
MRQTKRGRRMRGRARSRRRGRGRRERQRMMTPAAARGGQRGRPSHIGVGASGVVSLT